MTEINGRPVPRDEWRWFGHAAHLIVGQDCRFHLATAVGPWLVSTVGEYLPDEKVRDIIAEKRGIVLRGMGDERRGDFLKRIGFETIGYNRTYETMVFRIGRICTTDGCGCGMPIPADWSELDMAGYNDAGTATRGHDAMCDKWAAVTALVAPLLPRRPARDHAETETGRASHGARQETR